MKSYNLLIVALVIIVGITLIFLMNRKNARDRKSINPDSDEIVSEEHHDQQRRTDKS
jgi:hypothetical protein